MKKSLVIMGLLGSIIVYTGFVGVNRVQAQSFDLSQFKAFVQLMIAIGAIPADKIELAKSIVGITDSTPVLNLSGVSGSNVNPAPGPVVGSVEQAVTPSVIPAVTVSPVYCVEQTYGEPVYINGNYIKTVQKSYSPKQYAAAVDVTVNTNFAIADIATEGYVNQNNQPVLSLPRINQKASVTKSSPRFTFQNIPGVYPFSVVAYSDDYHKNSIASFNGQVTINQACQ